MEEEPEATGEKTFSQRFTLKRAEKGFETQGGIVELSDFLSPVFHQGYIGLVNHEVTWIHFGTIGAL